MGTLLCKGIFINIFYILILIPILINSEIILIKLGMENKISFYAS
jgi:hypothetical protein